MSNRARQKNKRGDSKVESNDSPDFPDRGEKSNIPGLPSRGEGVGVREVRGISKCFSYNTVKKKQQQQPTTCL